MRGKRSIRGIRAETGKQAVGVDARMPDALASPSAAERQIADQPDERRSGTEGVRE
jgi:hypothetical protein